jgi:hypothetical protein
MALLELGVRRRLPAGASPRRAPDRTHPDDHEVVADSVLPMMPMIWRRGRPVPIRRGLLTGPTGWPYWNFARIVVIKRPLLVDDRFGRMHVKDSEPMLAKWSIDMACR